MIKKVTIIVAVIVVILLGINLWDGPVPTFNVEDLKHLDTSSWEKFCDSVLDTVSFEKNNGYYRLCTLVEPDSVEIESDEIILKYRRLNDPGLDNDKYLAEWNADSKNWRFNSDEYDGYYKEYMLKRRWVVLQDDGVWDSWAGRTVEWCNTIVTQKKNVLELKELFTLFLQRYQKYVDSEEVEDFTAPRADAQRPHLLAWLHIGRLHNTVYMLEALDEDRWEEAVTHLLAHIKVLKKTIKSSRTLVTSLIGKALMVESLNGLAALMNRQEFPKPLLEKVAAGLPPIEYEEFGTRTALLLEGYGMEPANKWYYQKNRTTQYRLDYVSKLVTCDKTPPYQWKYHPLEDSGVKKGWLWWLQNPAAKIAFHKELEEGAAHNLFVSTLKAYRVKAIYDMTRISAELHRDYTPGKPIQQILNGLETYRSWIDHCSGAPYKWDEKRQILYGFGVDRDDDGGTVDIASLNTDHTLPVILYID
ncbi:MAG: hypothetical protein GY757_28015 [bacterium]|nr:hypothetical protein [bacterium]